MRWRNRRHFQGKFWDLLRRKMLPNIGQSPWCFTKMLWALSCVMSGSKTNFIFCLSSVFLNHVMSYHHSCRKICSKSCKTLFHILFQVLAKRLRDNDSAKIVAVDLQAMAPLPGVVQIQVNSLTVKKSSNKVYLVFFCFDFILVCFDLMLFCFKGRHNQGWDSQEDRGSLWRRFCRPGRLRWSSRRDRSSRHRRVHSSSTPFGRLDIFKIELLKNILNCKSFY